MALVWTRGGLKKKRTDRTGIRQGTVCQRANTHSGRIYRAFRKVTPQNVGDNAGGADDDNLPHEVIGVTRLHSSLSLRWRGIRVRHYRYVVGLARFDGELLAVAFE